MKRLFVVIDCRKDKNDKSWLTDGLHVEGYQTIVVDVQYKLSQLVRNGIKGRIFNYWLQVKQVWKILWCSGKGDVIVVWYSVTGQIMNLMSSLFGGRRLVLMNFLTPGKRPGVIGWIVRKAVSNPNNTILVNAKASIEQYKTIYKLQEGKSATFHYYPDVYDSAEPFVNPEERNLVNDKYFFIGGMSNRDWKLVADIAAMMPYQRFVCCALQNEFERQVQIPPKNLEIFYNLPPEEYYCKMSNSYCVLLPLRNDSVAGLITILKSLQLGVLCCVSNTPVTKQYFSENNQEYLIDREVDLWVEQIKRIVEMTKEDYDFTVKSMQAFIQRHYSPESALARLERIIMDKNEDDLCTF